MTKTKSARAGARASRQKSDASKAVAGPFMQLNLPRIGELYAGQAGRLAGLIKGEKDQSDYAVVAVDQKHWPKSAWGPTAKVAGAMSDYDGLANTKAMAAAGSEIAKKVLAMKIDGQNDIYIAARHEARLIYLNGCGPDSGYAWTSSQYRVWDDLAWIQFFDDGSQDTSHKSYKLPVVLVRRVAIR